MWCLQVRCRSLESQEYLSLQPRFKQLHACGEKKAGSQRHPIKSTSPFTRDKGYGKGQLLFRRHIRLAQGPYLNDSLSKRFKDRTKALLMQEGEWSLLSSCIHKHASLVGYPQFRYET